MVTVHRFRVHRSGFAFFWDFPEIKGLYMNAKRPSCAPDLHVIGQHKQNGRSQAVRLPKEFRFEGTEVKIRKEGRRVILEPLEKAEWPDGFWNIFTSDPDFEIPRPLPSKEFDLD